jgi:hypothetical protein
MLRQKYCKLKHQRQFFFKKCLIEFCCFRSRVSTMRYSMYICRPSGRFPPNVVGHSQRCVPPTLQNPHVSLDSLWEKVTVNDEVACCLWPKLKTLCNVIFMFPFGLTQKDGCSGWIDWWWTHKRSEYAGTTTMILTLTEGVSGILLIPVQILSSCVAFAGQSVIASSTSSSVPHPRQRVWKLKT